MTRRTLICLVGLVGLSAGAVRAADDRSATGTWTWTMTRQNGDTVEVTLKLKQDGEKLTGTVSGPNNTEIEIKDGKVKDGAVEFKVERERNGQTFTVSYTGKIEGDTIKGKSERTVDGNTNSRDWEAKRSK